MNGVRLFIVDWSLLVAPFGSCSLIENVLGYTDFMMMKFHRFFTSVISRFSSQRSCWYDDVKVNNPRAACENGQNWMIRIPGVSRYETMREKDKDAKQLKSGKFYAWSDQGSSPASEVDLNLIFHFLFSASLASPPVAPDLHVTIERVEHVEASFDLFEGTKISFNCRIIIIFSASYLSLCCFFLFAVKCARSIFALFFSGILRMSFVWCDDQPVDESSWKGTNHNGEKNI